MKSSFASIACVIASALLVHPAFAVDVRNADEDTYEVSTTGDNSEAANFELAPGQRESDVCALRCTVRVRGIGSIVADGDDVVVIHDRKLSKEPKRL